MSIDKALHPRDDKDCTCQEKEEENLPSVSIKLIQQFKDSEHTLKDKRKTNYSYQEN